MRHQLKEERPMKKIFVVHEDDEIICACDTMENAITACINRISICGYLCEGFDYGETSTAIIYRDTHAKEIRAMFIDQTTFSAEI